jgi:hypothetical protein
MSSTVSRIPIPDRGQPIDVPYLNLLATTINNLATQIDASTERYTVINTREIPSQELRTSDVKFFASYQDLFSEVDVRANETKEFIFQISGFKYPPIAVATPVNTGTSTASNNTNIVISSITNSEIRGFIRFNTSGKVSISVNLIAIGIPE